jgi:aspartate aminotransferase
VALFLGKRKEIEKYLAHFRKELEVRLREIHAGFNKLKNEGLPVDAVEPEAAIYLTIKLELAGKRTQEGQMLESQSDVTAYILNEAKLAVVPFYAFGAGRGSSWYRLSVGTCKKEEIAAMLEQLGSALRKLS